MEGARVWEKAIDSLGVYHVVYDCKENTCTNNWGKKTTTNKTIWKVDLVDKLTT